MAVGQENEPQETNSFVLQLQQHQRRNHHEEKIEKTWTQRASCGQNTTAESQTSRRTGRESFEKEGTEQQLNGIGEIFPISAGFHRGRRAECDCTERPINELVRVLLAETEWRLR